MEAYSNLVKKLDEVRANHEITMNGKGQDAIWVCVKFCRGDWRKAKKAGAKKDGYHGWILYSTSTNSMGYELYEALRTEVRKSELELRVTYIEL